MATRLITALLWRFLSDSIEPSFKLVQRANFNCQLFLLLLYLALDQNWILSNSIVINEAVDPHKETTCSSARTLDLVHGEGAVLGALEDFGEKRLWNTVKVVIEQALHELGWIGKEFLCF